MRPRTIDEYIGQDHIVGPGRLLRRMIQADQLSSIIFYGPPGTGKTTLARVIANTTESTFVTLNAVLSGVKDLRQEIAAAKERYNLYEKRTILFIDEVHRWNKAQQDALLPWVENGTVVLIGATTQNPYFEVISALVSRSRIFQLKPLEDSNLRAVAASALADKNRGYGSFDVRLEKDALAHLAHVAAGDARSLLNALQLAVETTPSSFPPPSEEIITITLEIAEESIQRKAVLYDKEGDYHFDTISAFIKSLRGSDPDAALYWMARMVHAGEDPHYIFRRMLILAGEDVGLADPHALSVVVAAAEAFDRIGLPEGQFHLAEACLYLATAPKSNSTLAFFDALEAVKEEAAQEVPNHLRDGNRDKEGFGHGEGYMYPHAYRDHWVAQQYLPRELQGRFFYDPSDQGYEGNVRIEVGRRREAQLAASFPDTYGEVLTFSPAGKSRDRWLERTMSSRSLALNSVREKIFKPLNLRRHHRVLVLNAGDGLLLWEACRQVPEGGTWAYVADGNQLAPLNHFAEKMEEPERPVIESGGLTDILAAFAESEIRFEAIIGSNFLTRTPDRKSVFRQLLQLLAPGGSMSISQTIPKRAQRLSAYLDVDGPDKELITSFRIAEESVFANGTIEMTSWDEDTLLQELTGAGAARPGQDILQIMERRTVTDSDIEAWFTDSSPYCKGLQSALGTAQLLQVKSLLQKRVAGTPLDWKRTIALLTACYETGVV
ncbi:MAG: AAA family ATPase [Spirochaetales bacterium]|nr:AAA family ATPase [Spirochaetales bacterium]